MTFPVIGVTLRVSQVDNAGNQVTLGEIGVTHAVSQVILPGSQVTHAGSEGDPGKTKVSPAGTDL